MSLSATLWQSAAVLLTLEPVLALPRSRVLPAANVLVGRDEDDDEDDDDDMFIADDLSFIRQMAAVGDSYSAGIGAGNKLGNRVEAVRGENWACSRYDQSYPYLVYADERLGSDLDERNFEFRSCSGAVIEDVLEKQIPELSDGQQVILLSAGGNDVGLTDILNQCVFQWLAFNPWQGLQLHAMKFKAKIMGNEAGLPEDLITEHLDFEKLALGCASTIDQAEAFVDSDDFSSRIDSVIGAAKEKLAPSGVLYYTGYGQFFNAKTEDCDNVTWSIWFKKTYNIMQDDEYLVFNKRRIMNELVLKVNSKLKEAVERAGEQVVFVDYDPYIEELKGRYCEEGVDESIKNSSDPRPDLMFYKLDVWDPRDHSPWRRTEEPVANGTFEGYMNTMAYLAMELDPEITLAYEPYFEEDDSDRSPLIFDTSGFDDPGEIGDPPVPVPNMLPDSWARAFHPRVSLHHLIANLVIHHMASRNAEEWGYDPIPEVTTVGAVCEKPSETPTSTTTTQAVVNTPPPDAKCDMDASGDGMEEEECKRYYSCPEGLTIGCKLRNRFVGDVYCTCYEDRSD